MLRDLPPLETGGRDAEKRIKMTLETPCPKAALVCSLKKINKKFSVLHAFQRKLETSFPGNLTVMVTHSLTSTEWSVLKLSCKEISISFTVPCYLHVRRIHMSATLSYVNVWRRVLKACIFISSV